MGLNYIKTIPNSIESLKAGRVTTITHSNINAITAFIKPKKPFEIGQILVKDVEDYGDSTNTFYVLLTQEGKRLYAFHCHP
nr:MAG TPA: hypothetical protein [Caudoviricetes sp.]